MASLSSSVFAPALLAPFTTAGARLAEDQVAAALEELSPEKLRGALHAAAARVASAVGVKLEGVLRLFPTPEIDAALAKLSVSQPRALTAWRQYAGGLGGLMARSSQIPGEGSAPALSERLRALAGTMQRDKVVAEPLEAFAGDLAEWEAVAARLPKIVEASPELARAVRMRQTKRIAILATIAAILTVIAVVARAAWVARENVRASLAKDDPCAAFDVSAVDLGRVPPDLSAQVQAKRKACEDRRAEEARLAEEERKRLAREEAERKAKQKLEGDCAALAAHVEAGHLVPYDDTFAADGGLTKRIAETTLEGRDFGPEDPKMPCVGSRAEPRLWEAFRKAVLIKPWIMLVTTAPSPRVREAFRPDGGKMPFKLRKVIATRANDLAKFAIRSGKTPDAARASAWCDVARSVGMPMAGPCDLADKLAAPR